MGFKLTYSTMFDPAGGAAPALRGGARGAAGRPGAQHALHVGGRTSPRRELREARTRRPPRRHRPLSARLGRGRGARGRRRRRGLRGLAQHAARRAAAPRRGGSAALIEERVYGIAAALALEVGKNRMESLGEAQETADFFSGYADELERRAATSRRCPTTPCPASARATSSVLKPYGVWGVITPFNFPLALAGGPVAAALVTGNTVVLKGASDTPWAGRLLADCLRDSGFPPGVFNYVTGRGSVVGEALRLRSPPRGGHLHGLARGRDGPATAHGRGRPAASRASPRWAARTPASSPREAISSARPPASCAPRSGSPARSAPRCRGSTSRTGAADALLRKAPREDPRPPCGRPVPARELDGPGDQRGGRRQLRGFCGG